jgi:hypothetical protein
LSFLPTSEGRLNLQGIELCLCAIRLSDLLTVFPRPIFPPSKACARTFTQVQQVSTEVALVMREGLKPTK